jgi:hypothetical protein
VARWENQGGTEEGEWRTDLCRGAFLIDPVPPFRPDFSVWTLRCSVKQHGPHAVAVGCRREL